MAEAQLDAPDGTPLYYAVATRGGELLTRGGRLVFADRETWEKLTGKHVAQLIPVGKCGPVLGALPLYSDGAPPDIIGALIDAVKAQLLRTEQEKADG